MEDAIGKNLEVFVTKTEAQATASDFVAAHPAALCISSDTKSIVFGGQVLTLGDHQAKVNKWVDEKRVLKLNGLEAVGSATINSSTIDDTTSTDQLIWATDKRAVYLKRDGQYYNNWTEYKMASIALIFGSDYCKNITASGCLAVIGVDLYLISKFTNHIQLTSASGAIADGSLTESKLSQDLADKINGKQEKLTLEVLNNGNIKIGNLNGQTKEFMPATPSGDPMHYAYEAMGAVWNGTGKDIVYDASVDYTLPENKKKKPFFLDWGDKYTHKAGHWLMNEVGDLTNKDMGIIFKLNPPILPGHYVALQFSSKARTNKVSDARFIGIGTDLKNCFVSTYEMGNIKITTHREGVKATSLIYAFWPSAARRILDEIEISSCAYSLYAFQKNSSLIYAKFTGLANNINILSPVLHKQTLKWLIEHEVGESQKVIELHPNVYATMSEDADIDAALEAHPLVSIIPYES